MYPGMKMAVHEQQQRRQMEYLVFARQGNAFFHIHFEQVLDPACQCLWQYRLGLAASAAVRA